MPIRIWHNILKNMIDPAKKKNDGKNKHHINRKSF